MEQLPINNDSGQAFGWISYRKRLSLQQKSIIKIQGRVRDFMLLLVNGILINEPILSITDLGNFGSWTTVIFF